MKNKTLAEFSELSASSAPVPGGGGVSAAVGALSASLGEMVTNLTIGKKKYLEYNEELEKIKAELTCLRTELLECINKDAEAFKPLSETYKMSKDDPDYESRMESCLKTAADSPYQILKHTCMIIELDERLSVIGSKLSVSDAATSVMLAHGVLYGAYINIIVNTNLMKDKEYADSLEKNAYALLKEYSEKALNIFEAIKTRLNNG
ncbi:MAG: cyclodeaminase/cyclohydrolase family protein [Erysipelotrichaceae bacterium]|nr:cyclodeaminase/cyclohydrolase family protein [Erysipelotrichaceae bacterium]